MDSRLAEVADDIARHDSDKLLANGRFIAEKFAVSSLRVPADAATVAVPASRRRSRGRTRGGAGRGGHRARARPLTDEAQAVPGRRAAGRPALTWRSRGSSAASMS